MELDPLSFAASNGLGVVLYLSRRFEEAAKRARKSLLRVPESGNLHFLLIPADLVFDPLRGEPRLQALFFRLGMTPH